MGDITFTAMTTFDSAMRLELNQQMPILADKTLKRDAKGAEKAKFQNLISNATMRRKTARNSDVQHDESSYDGIWVTKPDLDYLATLVDVEDELVTTCDLQGAELMNHMGARNRRRDAAFLEGLYGDMITGKTGTTLNAFPAANIVAVDYDGLGGVTALGFTVRKLRHMRKLLAGNFIDMSKAFYIGVTSTAVEQISSDAQVQNSDFLNAMKPKWSEDGKFLTGLAGFEFCEIELGNPLLVAAYTDGVDLSLSGSNRRLPVWTADGMLEANWENLFTNVEKLPTKHFSAQVYSRHIKAYSRTDQGRVGQILVTE